MQRLISALGVIVLTALLAFQATSDEPMPPGPVTKSPYRELRSTLNEAYRLRLEEYKAGRSTPANVIRVNQELYDIERRVKIVGKETEPQEKYVARAQAIEEVANAQFTNGTGSKVDFLDAKAARLRAEMELYSAAKDR